jgi:hypothetical protein
MLFGAHRSGSSKEREDKVKNKTVGLMSAKGTVMGTPLTPRGQGLFKKIRQSKTSKFGGLHVQ